MKLIDHFKYTIENNFPDIDLRTENNGEKFISEKTQEKWLVFKALNSGYVEKNEGVFIALYSSRNGMKIIKSQ